MRVTYKLNRHRISKEDLKYVLGENIFTEITSSAIAEMQAEREKSADKLIRYQRCYHLASKLVHIMISIQSRDCSREIH